VRFADIDKVNIGTRVTFAGKAIGKVIAIKKLEDERLGPKDTYGHVYVYQLTLALDSGEEVFNTDEIGLRTSGLLGERSVAIIPVAPKEGVVLQQLGPDDIIYAEETGSVESTMAEFKELADKMNIVLDGVHVILEDIRKEEVVNKVAQAIQNITEITAAINQPDELTAIINNFQEFTAHLATRLPASWDTIDEALGSLNDSTENIRHATHTADVMITDISKGKGSAGKILVDDELYLRITSLLGKGEIVLNDINHYGILYHLDKGWQRLRARRMNLLETLNTPQEFRNYFNDEIDMISTSLSRVSMVLDKVEFCSPCLLIDDIDFRKVFAELMRRVQEFEESLNLYNQQVVDCTVQRMELTPCRGCER
jgi:phospholipid/cholesterol/gamma-HCH transport system substrate-binding protein